MNAVSFLDVKVPIYETNFCQVFSGLHWKHNLNSQYNLFCRIFVTLLLVETFNFIGYANYTTCDITLHNDSQCESLFCSK